MCDASGTPAPSYAELESQLAAAVAAREEAERELARLEGAADEARAVLTRLADSAVYWSSYDVPVGIVADVDAAKARLAGVLR